MKNQTSSDKVSINHNWPEDVKQFYQQTSKIVKPFKIVLVFSLNDFDSRIFVNYLIENYCHIKSIPETALFKTPYPVVELKTDVFP